MEKMVLISEETYSKIPSNILTHNDKVVVRSISKISQNTSVNGNNTSEGSISREEEFNCEKNQVHGPEENKSKVMVERNTDNINALIKDLPKQIKQKALVLLCCLYRDGIIQRIKKKYIIDGKIFLSKNNMVKLLRNYYENTMMRDRNTKMFKQILQKLDIPLFIKKTCKKKTKSLGWVCIKNKHSKKSDHFS